MDADDTTRRRRPGKPGPIGRLSPSGVDLLPAETSTDRTLARASAALVFGLSATAAAAAVLLSPRVLDRFEHAPPARQVAAAGPRSEAARLPPVAAAVAPPQLARPEPLPPQALAGQAVPEPVPAAPILPVLLPEAAAPDQTPPAPSEAMLTVAPDIASADPGPATPSAPSLDLPAAISEAAAAPIPPQPPFSEDSSAVERPSFRDPTPSGPELRADTPEIAAPVPDPSNAVPAPNPPAAPSLTAGLVTPEPPVALLRQPPVAPPPGLLLVARPGDTLQHLYKSVYSGVRPPPYHELVEANPSPIRPGVVLLFPTPPDGWRRP